MAGVYIPTDYILNAPRTIMSLAITVWNHWSVVILKYLLSVYSFTETDGLDYDDDDDDDDL